MEVRHRLFLGIAVFVLVVGCFFSSRFEIYLVKQGLAGTQLRTESVTDSEMEDQFLWFSYEDGQMVLKSQSLFTSIPSTIQYLDLEGTVHTVDTENMVFDGGMSGTYFAMAEKTVLDLDGNGEMETIYATAKTDANETQGYAHFSRVLGSEEIPIELVMSSNEGLTVLQYGVPYVGKLKLVSKRGLNKEIECTGEEIPVDLRDLRSGLLVKIENEKQEVFLGSYLAQEHTIFTKEHFKVMQNIFLLVVLAAVGISAICWIRKTKDNF